METTCSDSFFIKASAIMLGLVIGLCTASAFAVHDQEFELEGNVANDGSTVQGSNDWVDMFDVSSSGATPKSTLPADFGPAAFVRDFKLKPNGAFDSSDDSVFTQGSKDILNPTGGWKCTKKNNVLNQDDLINVYAAAYADPDTGELKLYFGAERNGNNGTKNIGFWFLQDSTVGCDASGGTSDFTGNHRHGDLFIVSEFSNGGRVSTIQVYKWIGDAGGYLDPTALAVGGDCKDDPSGDADKACATVNSPDTVGTLGGVFTPPWLTQTDIPGNAQSTDVQEYEFFEGGLNLTRLELAACFTRFLVNTRSSDSLTATIFDYAVGNFNLCGISVGKLCSHPDDVGPNPVIDTADYESFITKFDVTIEKSGPAGLFDPTLEEDSTFGTNDSCSIINITGCAGGAPTLPVTGFEDGSPVQVCDTLGISSITVRIECDTAINGYLNSVTARASALDNGDKDITDSDTMSQEEACSATVNPLLSVNKICHDETAVHDLTAPALQASHPSNPAAVELVYDGASFSGFGVDVFVQIENTGNIKLENVTVSDAFTSSNDVVVFTPVTISQGTNTHTPTTFDGELIPGGKAYFTGDYVAAAPDGNAADPCVAQFSDTATVTATDATSGIPLDPPPMDSAVCPLCACP